MLFIRKKINDKNLQADQKWVKYIQKINTKKAGYESKKVGFQAKTIKCLKC